MQTTLYVATSAVTALIFGLVGYGSTALVKDVAEPPQPRSIEAVSLQWDGQRIGQELIVTSGPINGDWAASIWRDGKRICGDGGSADYETRTAGNVKWMEPDIWTGDECPDVQPGDIARATWEWWAEDGSRKSTSIQIVIPKG